ncbi:MAG: shikimate kinase [Syntrophales bacterium]
MHVILIGYRGTGKSAVGRRLAEKLKMPFYDTDELIEQEAARSIGDMVAEEGWEYFRKRECEIIGKLAVLQRGIVATGGGAVLDRGNCDMLKEHGLLIWLRADMATIVERIRDDATNKEPRPPLLHDDACGETEDILSQRLPIYRKLADFSIDTTDKSIDEIAAAVCLFMSGTGRFIKKESACQEIP